MRKEWDYSSLVSGDLDEQIDIEKKVVGENVGEFVSKWKGNIGYLEDSNVLREALDDLESLFTNYGTDWNVGQYLFLAKMKNQADDNIKAKYELVGQFSEEFSNSLIFFELSLSKISKEKQEEFLNSKDLVEYKHYLEKLFRSGKFLLSEEVEKVLTLKNGPAYEAWVDMVSELLSKEEREVWTGESKEIKGFSEILALLSSTDSKVRESCVDAFNDILKNYVDVATAQINAILKDKKVNDELRGFSRPDESRIVSDDIDLKFVDDLLDVVSSRYDISRRFYELKAKLFGVSKLKYEERVVPYGKISKKVDYEEGVKVVDETFSRMDEEFGKIFRGFVEDGDIDVYPAKGKRQGAFCSWGLKIHHTRILLNYMDRINDVVTLAHEAGHGLNHELMKKQSALDFGVPTAVAEVASNFAEGVVFENLLSKVDNDEERLALMVSKIGDDLASIFRQVACYKFERELHDEFRLKGAVSAVRIGEIFRKNMKGYMGDAVEHPEWSKNWWVYWWHIRDYFYVYSYASGSLIASAMIKKYKENPDFILKVKEFLGFGESRSPRESFESLGISLDKDFWNEGLDNVEAMLDETWRLAERLGKI